jgi:hypothetical protein
MIHSQSDRKARNDAGRVKKVFGFPIEHDLKVRFAWTL